MGELRTRDTVIVKRAPPRAPPPSSTVKPASPPPPAPHVPGEGAVWHAQHLEELTHGREARRRAEQKAAAKAAEDAARNRRERALYVHGGFLGPSPIEHLLGNKSGAGAHDFLERQDAANRAFQAKKSDASLAADYAARVDKKSCPECGTLQSFEEWKNGVKRCPRDRCGGALYRPKKVWSDFQKEFLAKWRSDLEGRAEKLKQMEKEAAPPGHLVGPKKIPFDAEFWRECYERGVPPPWRPETRQVIDPATGREKEVPIPQPKWQEVEDGFLQRNEEGLKRRIETLKRNEEERIKPPPLPPKPVTRNSFRFSAPLPDFHERQRAFDERKNRPYEEKLNDYLEKYHPDD